MSYFTNERGEMRPLRTIGWGILVFFGLIIVFSSFGTIDEGERGVRTTFGEVKSTQEPGLYFKIPIVEGMTKMNVRTQTVQYGLDNPLFAASNDLQDVNVSTVINYHVDPEQVEEIYRQYKSIKDYEADIIRPAIRDTVKNDASRFTAEELVTKRGEYTDSIQKTLTERLEQYNITVERVNVTNIQFSSQYTASIEAKVTAEQNALKAEQDLKRVEFEAQQRVAQAEAEAEAIRIQAQAINSQGGADYVNLKAIEQWDGQLPTQFVPGSAVPFINI